MERKTAQDFDQELLLIFDQYVHGAIDRRGFLDRATKFAVGGVTAGMLLDSLSPKFAEAQQVPKDDKRLKTDWVEIGRAHQRRVAGVGGGAQGEQRAPRRLHLRRHATRLQQRHHAALRRGGRQAGVGAHHRALQSVREGLVDGQRQDGRDGHYARAVVQRITFPGD